MVILQDSSRNLARLCIILQDNHSKSTGDSWAKNTDQHSTTFRKTQIHPKYLYSAYNLVVQTDRVYHYEKFSYFSQLMDE